MESSELRESRIAAEAPRGEEVRSARAPRRVFSLIGAVAAVLMAALLVRALVANPGGPMSGWIGSNPGLSNGGQSVTLNGQQGINLTALSMSSPSDGWLFGAKYTTSPGESCSNCGSFTLRYDGAHWKRVSWSGSMDIPPAAVSMVASDNGWAVAQGVIFHFTGDAWHVAYTYSVPDDTFIYLNAIAMVSPSEGWVGGSDGGPNSVSGFLLHYAGGRWQRVALPDGHASGINAISMLSPEEGWALETVYGEGVGASTRLLHYLNGTWHPVGDVIPATLTGLSAVSSQTVWMVGAVTGTTGGIFAYEDGQIKRIKSPTPNILRAITMLSPTDGWAVGDGAATLHWDGTRWTKVGLVIHGVALMSVSFPTPNEGWAEGNSLSSDVNGAALLHYAHGTWRVFPLTIGG